MNDLSTIFLIILYLFILAWSISLCTKWIEPFEFSFIKNKDWRIAIKGSTTILAGLLFSAIISLGIIFVVMALAGSKSKKGNK